MISCETYCNSEIDPDQNFQHTQHIEFPRKIFKMTMPTTGIPFAHMSCNFCKAHCSPLKTQIFFPFCYLSSYTFPQRYEKKIQRKRILQEKIGCQLKVKSLDLKIKKVKMRIKIVTSPIKNLVQRQRKVNMKPKMIKFLVHTAPMSTFLRTTKKMTKTRILKKTHQKNGTLTTKNENLTVVKLRVFLHRFQLIFGFTAEDWNHYDMICPYNTRLRVHTPTTSFSPRALPHSPHSQIPAHFHSLKHPPDLSASLLRPPAAQTPDPLATQPARFAPTAPSKPLKPNPPLCPRLFATTLPPPLTKALFFRRLQKQRIIFSDYKIPENTFLCLLWPASASSMYHALRSSYSWEPQLLPCLKRLQKRNLYTVLYATYVLKNIFTIKLSKQSVWALRASETEKQFFLLLFLFCR
ncbi:hypothetical protein VP01_24g2 [Puccinia sorghi]|uniref:Uncharacterized protein n=1 Tax=Puccinia sorghi TaxID=27349 RepID=A0A0L6V5J7_9BASI|nr:hypothetical protein VP01_24g2 [Puccinia sorghi]